MENIPAPYDPASCHIHSPPWIQKKRCVLNINSLDDKCFAWVLLRARYPMPQKKRRTVKDPLSHLHEVVLPEGLHYPIPLDREVYQHIEGLNPWCSFSVFLLGEEEGSVKPYYTSMWKNLRPLHVCIGALLPLEELNQGSSHPHYVFIRRLDFLLGKSCHLQRVYCCENCLALQPAQSIRQHEKECYGLGISKEAEMEEPPLKKPHIESQQNE
jgi:hypothetical protein